MKRFNRWFRTAVCLPLLFAAAVAFTEDRIKIGDTLEVVVKVLGEPEGTSAAGNRKMLIFDEGLVTLVDEKVVKFDFKADPPSAPAPTPTVSPAKPVVPVKKIGARGYRPPKTFHVPTAANPKPTPVASTPVSGEDQAARALAEINAKIKKLEADIAEATRAANKTYIRGASRRRRAARVKRAKLQEELEVLSKRKKALQ